MTNRLDDLLKRLPDESIAADLVTRIATTVAARRVSQRTRRIIGVGVVVSSVLGLAFLSTDWPVLLNATMEISALLAASLFDFSTNLTRLAAPSSDPFGAALVLGLTLLLVATFGGLLQLLNTPTQSVDR